MAWSFDGEPVNRPALIPWREGSAFVVSSRALPAASHASLEVSARTYAQAADGFFADVGITNDVPLATVNGWPSCVFSGMAPISTLSAYGVSTFTYHWSN